jgi:(p)ppGpp synthase/HD superfamily hydrolase
LAYVAEMHREQPRKGIPVPYLSHLLGVASLVLEYGGDEDQAISALLHDTLEDCGEEHAPVIEERFGPTLALVRACSDDEVSAGAEKRAWRLRKEGYLAHLEKLGADHPALLVSAADKLHNARAIRADLRRHGSPSGTDSTGQPRTSSGTTAVSPPPSNGSSPARSPTSCDAPSATSAGSTGHCAADRT